MRDLCDRKSHDLQNCSLHFATLIAINRYSQRQTVLNSCKTQEKRRSPKLSEFAIFGAPIAMLSFRQDDRVWPELVILEN
jgi:hypothetical protein